MEQGTGRGAPAAHPPTRAPGPGRRRSLASRSGQVPAEEVRQGLSWAAVDCPRSAQLHKSWVQDGPGPPQERHRSWTLGSAQPGKQPGEGSPGEAVVQGPCADPASPVCSALSCVDGTGSHHACRSAVCTQAWTACDVLDTTAAVTCTAFPCSPAVFCPSHSHPRELSWGLSGCRTRKERGAHTSSPTPWSA